LSKIEGCSSLPLLNSSLPFFDFANAFPISERHKSCPFAHSALPLQISVGNFRLVFSDDDPCVSILSLCIRTPNLQLVP
jgi:hypothetical protein